MIEDTSSDAYEPLKALADRRMTEVKLKTGKGDDKDFADHFSAPIAQISRLSQKFYGYMRDCNVESFIEKSAVMGSNSLNDLIMDAPCVNREGRYREEEGRAKEWLRILEEREDSAEQLKKVDEIIDRWSSADSFMMQARIIEEQRGIEVAEELYPEYIESQKTRDAAEMDASKLPAAANMFFHCRRRQVQIMRERGYDLAMGYPTHDFTELKAEISEGTDAHDLVHKTPWAYREGYQLNMASMIDGEAHRTLLMSLLAGQLPAPPMPYMPWGMPPNPMGDGGDGDGDGEEPDKRKAIFSFMNRNGAQPAPPKQQQPARRRGRRSRNR